MYKQMIVLRKDLNMRKGKMVAQGSHASMGSVLENRVIRDLPDGTSELAIPLTPQLRAWLEGRFTKVCVSVGSEQELLDLHAKAQSLGVASCLIQDAGLTEFGGVPTYTSLALGPDTSEVLDPLTGHLSLL